MKSTTFAAAVLFGLISSPVHSYAASLSSADMVQMQSAMQMHIDNTVVDGALLDYDPATGKTVAYYPSKAHPKIMVMGDKYVMCADVVDAEGKLSEVNFYMARSGQRYVVFHTTFGEDEALMDMVKDGKASMAN